jgi:AraC-like DNA-binding protein
MEQEFHAAPAGQLGRAVSMVGYRSSGLPPSVHRGLPSAWLTVVLSLDGPIDTGDRADPASAKPLPTLVGGLHTSPAYIFRGDHDAGVQLAVHPLAARRLLGLPAAELDVLAIDGTAVLGDRLTGLVDRLGETAGWAERFAAVHTYVGRRARTSGGPGPRREVVAAWDWLAARRGRGRMDDLARHVALSGRQLTAVFRAEVGHGPKTVARLMRFEHARDRLARGERLADVAQACGYYDHAHLDREFREYAGTSPTAWLDEERGNLQDGGHGLAATSEHD